MSAPAVARGAVRRLSEIVAKQSARRVLLVSGGRSYEASGAAAAIETQLAGLDVVRFHGFEANPQIGDLRTGIKVGRDAQADVVVAVGGGSVLDMAKMVNVFAANDVAPEDHLRTGEGLVRRGVPLVAIPTTAGSGSEATQFAVLYIDGKKHSVDHPFLLPDHALLDPALTDSLSPRLTASTGVDALAQAIESHWSVRSTSVSQELSRRAISLAWTHLPTAVHSPIPTARGAMMEAANLAGRAINLTRTTAPHALSYGLTIQFGVPHGHAVGLTLGEFLLFNSQVDAKDCQDSRGPQQVKRAVDEIVALLGAKNVDEAREFWYSMVEELRLSTRLGSFGVDALALPRLAREVNVNRLNNNPRRVTLRQLEEVLERRLGSDHRAV